MKNDNRISEVIMGRLKVCFRHSVSSAVWHESKLEIDNIVDTMEKQFTLKVLFPKEPIKIIRGYTTVYVPETWIDHLRLKHFPDFLINKYPIKLQAMNAKYEHEVGAVYPKFPLIFPKQEVRFYETKTV